MNTELQELHINYNKISKFLNLLNKSIQLLKNSSHYIQEILERNNINNKEKNLLTLLIDKEQDINLLFEHYNSPLDLNNASEQYIRFISNNFIKIEYALFYQVNDLPEYPSEIEIVQFITDHLSYINTENFDNSINLLHNFKEQKLLFDNIKNIKTSIILIGANGSGKSRISRFFYGKLSDNMTILPAQKILYYENNSIIKTYPYTGLNTFDENTTDKTININSDTLNIYTSDMTNLINSLITDHLANAVSSKNSKEKTITTLDRVIEIWNELNPHRELNYSFQQNIYVTGKNIDPYEFNELSDGEKSIFYYIGHVLLSKSPYIIVDEPETNLHPLAANALWTKLENEKPNSLFIFITHNVDFATSRSNVTILWNKYFSPSGNWEYEILPESDELPAKLIIELLGSRKKVCFCEGKNSSIDYKLYSILFPNFTLTPVDGHLNVINYTQAYNKLTNVPPKAIGIIDGDYHLPERVTKWKKNNIYTFDSNEVENLLLDRKILESLNNTDSKFNIEDYYEFFWKTVKTEKDNILNSFITEYTNNLLKSQGLNIGDITSITSQLNNIIDISKITTAYNERKKSRDNIIRSNNYDAAVKNINIMKKVKSFFSENPTNTILDLINETPELQEYLIYTYFNAPIFQEDSN